MIKGGTVPLFITTLPAARTLPRSAWPGPWGRHRSAPNLGLQWGYKQRNGNVWCLMRLNWFFSQQITRKIGILCKKNGVYILGFSCCKWAIEMWTSKQIGGNLHDLDDLVWPMTWAGNHADQQKDVSPWSKWRGAENSTEDFSPIILSLVPKSLTLLIKHDQTIKLLSNW